jgi:hypothetical protein
MRTTLNLNDALMRKAKKVAAQSERTVTAIIEAALRDYLYPHERPHPPAAPLPSSRCRGGLQPGVQLRSTSDLLHDLEADDAHF